MLFLIEEREERIMLSTLLKMFFYNIVENLTRQGIQSLPYIRSNSYIFSQTAFLFFSTFFAPRRE
jgi:hypothetical protein